MCMCHPWCRYHIILSNVALQSVLKLGTMSPSTVFIFLNNYSVYSRCFDFPCKLENPFVYFLKRQAVILLDCVKPADPFGKNYNLNYMSLPIHEQDVHLHYSCHLWFFMSGSPSSQPTDSAHVLLDLYQSTSLLGSRCKKYVFFYLSVPRCFYTLLVYGNTVALSMLCTLWPC